jgi:hypothetical protein
MALCLLQREARGQGEDNMKTDKDKLTELLTSFGVEWREKNYEAIGPSCSQIKVGGFNNYEKVVGYQGFYTLFEFDGDDKFIQMGAWE